MKEREDHELVSACLRGDNGCFAELVDRYQKPVYNLAYRMSGDPDDAQDITQSAFVKAFEHLATFDPHRKFFSWLYRIAINEALNFQRSRRPVTETPEDLVSDHDQPHEAMEDAEHRESIGMAVQRLKPDYRAVVVLHYFNGCSYGHISDILGIPERTVKSRLHSARQQLRRWLGRKGPT